jgi:DNA (cytosine-5)-methyltransferase 1
MRILWQSEIDPFACKVLAVRWPGVPNLGNINAISKPPRVRLMCGGFPCTDLSHCHYGSHRGLAGDASGLFFQMARIVRQSKPEWVLMENVPKALKWLDVIRSHMPEHKIEGEVFDAADFGALTRRKRAFIVGCLGAGGASEVFAKLEGRRAALASRRTEDALPMCLPWKGGPSLERLASCVLEDTEDDPTRIREGNGISGRLDGRRYLALGNAVCPSMAKAVGECIMEVV